MFHAADAVVEAVVTSSRRWNSSRITVHLAAKYRVLSVFKGNVGTGEVLIGTDTCLEQPVPEDIVGYPPAQSYCPDGTNLSLTGVNAESGKPLELDGPSGWILHIDLEHRRGAPETWLEVERTSFFGGCNLMVDDLSLYDKASFDRMKHGRSEK